MINPQDISRLVAFDTWILNCDRRSPEPSRRPNYKNVFFSEEGTPGGLLVLRAMDHTHVFTCGRDLTPKIAAIGRIRDPGVYGVFDEFRVGGWIDGAILRQSFVDLGKLTQPIVETIVNAIPGPWDVSSGARAALIELIVQRARFLASNPDVRIDPKTAGG